MSHFSAAGAAQNSELVELLNNFREEPTDPADLESKFQLYENFQSTVQVVRDATLDFWSGNRHLFADIPEVQAHTEHELANIDAAGNLGIAVDDHLNRKSWIIYGMTKKCHENAEMITGLLATIKARLNLLESEPGDCPCCLEKVAADNMHRLGCCHTTCASCWEQWKALKGDLAFCPVCRARDFVHEIVKEAGP